MADRNKFEEMLEKLVNEDRKAAEELFHEIVVEKSRTIYENLLETDLEVDESDDEEVDEASDEEVDETTDEEVDESKDEDDEEVDEATDEEVDENFTEFTPEAEDDMGGDPTDDMMADIEGGDDEGDDEGEEELEDRVVDLEDALDDLKSEFEKMMDGDEGDMDDEGDDAEMDMDDEGDEEQEDEAFDASDLGVDTQPAYEGEKTQAEQMREYVEKVAEPKGEDNKAKSPVAGKNDMGGTTANIAKGSAEEKGGTGASAPKEDNAGNVNVPGAKASKSMSNAKGHGAEKKGTGETGVDDKSIIGS